MKKFLLSLLLVFGSLNIFAQDNGWVKKTSPITGESWIQKLIVNEMGEETNLIFKVRIREPRGAVVPNQSNYLWGVFNNQTTTVKTSIAVKKGEEWEYWSQTFEGGLGLWMTYDDVKVFTNSSLFRITYPQGEGFTLYYLDLKGSSNALKSL